MKRIIAFIVTVFVCANLFAQHISFMGIQLGQSELAFDRKLKEKGFHYCGINNAKLTRMYEGKFWRFAEVTVNVESEEDKVTSVFVGTPYIDANYKMTDYNLLVHYLDEKYGTHHPISNFFKYSDISGQSGFYWKTAGGYIVAYYFHYPTDYERILISLRYMDNTNHRVLLERGNKRNTENDL